MQRWVAKGELAHEVYYAESLAARRHVHGLASTTGVEQLVEKIVNLVVHV